MCLFDRKMFIGGLNWQTTPGMYPDAILFNTTAVVKVAGCCMGCSSGRGAIGVERVGNQEGYPPPHPT